MSHRNDSGADTSQGEEKSGSRRGGGTEKTGCRPSAGGEAHLRSPSAAETVASEGRLTTAAEAAARERRPSTCAVASEELPTTASEAAASDSKPCARTSGSDRRDAAGTIDRRRFLTTLAAGAAATPFLSPARLLASSFSGRAAARTGGASGGGGERLPDAATIIEAYHQDATDGPSPEPTVVRAMIDAAIQRLTGAGSVGEAWLSLFPGITAESRISIKINCISASKAHLTVHPAVVEAVTAGLQLMSVGGGFFPAEGITVWDMTEDHLDNAGFEINTSGVGVAVVANDTPGVGYDYTYPIDPGGQTQYPSKVLTERTDFLINMALIKDHSIAGATFSLKNNYGSVNAPFFIHGNKCDPYIANLNADSLFTEKTVLVMFDSLFGVYSGGPTQYPQEIYNTIHMTTDRLAPDVFGLDLLNETRQSHGMNPVTAPHIDTAGELGLGSSDYQVEQVVPDSVRGEADTATPPAAGAPVLHPCAPNPFNPRTLLRFTIPPQPAAGAAVRARLTVYDQAGRLTRRLVDRRLPPGVHTVPWNGLTSAGRPAAAGVYTARLEAAGAFSTTRLVLAK